MIALVSAIGINLAEPLESKLNYLSVQDKYFRHEVCLWFLVIPLFPRGYRLNLIILFIDLARPLKLRFRKTVYLVHPLIYSNVPALDVLDF